MSCLCLASMAAEAHQVQMLKFEFYLVQVNFKTSFLMTRFKFDISSHLLYPSFQTSSSFSSSWECPQPWALLQYLKVATDFYHEILQPDLSYLQYQGRVAVFFAVQDQIP